MAEIDVGNLESSAEIKRILRKALTYLATLSRFIYFEMVKNYYFHGIIGVKSAGTYIFLTLCQFRYLWLGEKYSLSDKLFVGFTLIEFNFFTHLCSMWFYGFLCNFEAIR